MQAVERNEPTSWTSWIPMVIAIGLLLLWLVVDPTAQSRQTVPAGASVPADCAVGDLFVRNATQIDLNVCSAANTWRPASSRILGQLSTANFNSTADQAITLRSTRYIIRAITVDNASVNLTTAAGGFYTGAGKSGTILVAATQVYTALTTSAKYLDVTLAAAPMTDVQTVTTIFLSLTTPMGGGATADVRIVGDPLP